MISIIKNFLIKTLFIFEPIVDIILFKMVYLIKLSKWCRNHPHGNFINYIRTKRHVDREDLYSYIVTKESLRKQKIDYLEFGVYKGASLKWWSEDLKNPQSRFFAFDTFKGLPTSYRNLPKEYFSTNSKLPKINDDRIKYEIGLFQKTLIPFLSKFSIKNRVILHLDADLYSSTLYVLSVLIPRLKKGSIIIFDEFSGSCGQHEFRAFIDFLSIYNVNYKLLGSNKNYFHVAFKLL